MIVIISGILGFAAAIILGGWMWIRTEPGNERPLSDAEIRERVGEVYL